MAGQPEIDPVPPRSEFRMVIDRLGMLGDAGQERKGFGKILEALASLQRLVVGAWPPSFGNVHPLRS